MTTVALHVYDATNTPNENANAAIQRLNGVTREVGFGVFHGAVEVLGLEWSFGFCEQGTGVYGCQPKGNSMYSYRETILLGVTALSPNQVGGASRPCRQWCWAGLPMMHAPPGARPPPPVRARTPGIAPSSAMYPSPLVHC